MKSITILAGASALALYAPSVSAADALADERVIVTATKQQRDRADTGSQVTVIGRDEIERKGAVFVLDILRDVPGVGVTQTGGPGGQASVRLRGEEGYRTLLLVDGMKLSDPAGTQNLFNFANLLARDVERIEILRGPQALLYGADAIGGVIAITTRRGGATAEQGLTVEAGGYGARAGGAFVRGMAGAVDYALNLSGFENDGISAKTAPGFVEDDGYRNLTLHGVFGVSLGPDLRVEAAGRYVDARAEFDGFFGEDNVLYTEQASGRLQVSGASGDKRVSGQLAASYMTQNRADYENGAPFLFGSRFDSERTRLEALGRWTVADGHDLAAGADFEDESAVTDALSRGRTIAGIFLDYQGRVAPGTFVTLGARFDDHEEFGQHLSWRATAAHRLAGTAAWSLTAKASAGTGFRAPSLFELYDGFSGDPSLKEETGIGWDLGLDWNGAEWGLDASMAYFDQRIEDEIRFDPNLFVYVQNPATARSRGVETSLSAALTQALRFSGTYTYTHAEIGSQDAEDGLPRPRRPRHIASASLDYVFGEGRGGVTATVRTAAGHEDGFFVFRTPLDARAVFDLSARYRVTGGLTLTLRGQNILDERYAEAAGFSAPRAAMFAGADWRF